MNRGTDDRTDADRPAAQKSADAFRTIGEVAEELKLPQHVLRFWETRFPQVRPLKRAGGRRFYRPADVALLRAIQALLYGEGYTIKGVQRLLQEFGARQVADALPGSAPFPPEEGRSSDADHDEGTPTAMPNDRPAGRRDPGLAPRHPAPAPAAGIPPDRGAAEPQPDGMARQRDVVGRLEGVLADLADCERLLLPLRAARD